MVRQAARHSRASNPPSSFAPALPRFSLLLLAPVQELFTEANGVMDWVGDFWPNADGRFNGVDDGPGANRMDWLPHWGPERPGDEYLTDKLTRHTVDFIKKYKASRLFTHPSPANSEGRLDRVCRDQAVPFFIYLAYNAPHNPWQAKLSDRNETIARLWNEPKAIYAAMVKAVDDGVGRVNETRLTKHVPRLALHAPRRSRGRCWTGYTRTESTPVPSSPSSRITAPTGAEARSRAGSATGQPSC